MNVGATVLLADWCDFILTCDYSLTTFVSFQDCSSA